jgi:acetyl-CoA/propionyl-CoA carboxylase biotin carboxyl carrier protein
MSGRTPAFRRILVANRGEIAVRVFRTLRELGIGAVAVYSEADRGSLHVEIADDAYLVGPGPAVESYLRAEAVIAAALRAGADAIHPGYGFLAENAAFARAVEEAGLVWIGPPPEAIEAMGSKIEARRRMQAAGVPIVPGTTDPVESADAAAAIADELGYPVAIKASGGGGGKGLKIAAAPGELERAYTSARREGEAYFADPAVFVERYLEDPRHVEVQILADRHGNVVHLGERDCTIQRRHQKLVEETPSPAVDDDLRGRIGEIAVEAARATGYRSAGTVEGLLTRDGEYFFLEMNTRIQVEHTVTELVTGLDLVREQILIAAGRPLSVTQDDVLLRGHAIECRINAEDVAKGFLPAPGRITAYREPGGPGVRVDSGVRAGDSISELYDPMIAKLVVHDVDRDAARRRMLRALEEFVVEGPPTLIGFHRALLEHECFVAGSTCDGVVESDELARRALELTESSTPQQAGLTKTADAAGSRSQLVAVEVDGRSYAVNLVTPEPAWAPLARRRRRRSSGLHGGGSIVVSPMQGTVLAVKVQDGDTVSAGQVLCVVEAMKMENEIVAHRDGVVRGLALAAGDPIASGQTVCAVAEERTWRRGPRTSRRSAPRRRSPQASRLRAARRGPSVGCWSKSAAPGAATSARPSSRRPSSG